MTATPKQTCLENLRARILTMEIAPGADLDEAALSARYGVSRTPLREVLQRLAGEGYVEQSEHRSARVASMDLPTMRIFFQTAPLIYASVARLAAEHRGTTQLAELKAVQTRFARAVAAARPTDMALENHRFHALIGEMARNVYLKPSLSRLLIDHARLGQTFYRPAAPAEAMAVRKASEQHDAMIEALEARDAEAVVELTMRHWALSRDRIERFVRPDPLPGEFVIDQTENEEARHAV